MSCFLNTDTAPSTDEPSFYLDGLRIGLDGQWATERDSKGLDFRVSKTSGDTLSLVFTGTYIYVAGRINSKAGMDALFGIDEVGSEGGGVLCATTAQPSSSVLLYGVSSLPTGTHTLFITNRGHELSLSGFQVSPASTSTTSTSLASPITSPTSTTSLLTSPPMISSASPRTGASLSLPSPSPPLRTSSLPVQSSSSNSLSQDRSSSTMATLSDISVPSYSVSTYTRVSTLDGSITTLVISSTVSVQPDLTSHGPSRGTIPGAVVGGVIFLSLLLGLGLWWRRHRSRGGRVRFAKDNWDPDPGPEIATRLIPRVAESIRRPRSLANPSSILVISPGGAHEPFYHDTNSGEPEVRGPPSTSELPTFSFHTEPFPGDDDSPLRSEDTDVAIAGSQATSGSKPDSTPGAPLFTPSPQPPPSPEPDGNIAPLLLAAHSRGERSVWRNRGGTRVQQLLRVEEDGGVRLAGGPFGDVREEDGSGGWVEVLPPPYHHFQ